MPRDPAESPELVRARRKLEEQRKALEESGEKLPDAVEETEDEEVQEVEDADEQGDEDQGSEALPEDDGEEGVESSSSEDELRKQLAASEEKISELTRKLNQSDGRFGSELDTLRRQLELANHKLAKALEEQEKQAKQLEKPAADPEDDFKSFFKGIPQSTLDGYDEDSLRMLVQVAKNAAMASMPKSETPDTSRLEKSVEELKAQSAYNSFVSAVEALAPGFAAANGNQALGIPSNPEWLEFLSRPVNPEVSPQTWHQLATQVGTPEVAANIFKTFQREKSGTNSNEEARPKEDRPSPRSQVVPPRSSVSRRPEPKVERLAREDYDALLRRMTNPSEFTEENKALLRKYQQADLEGRLE